MVFHTDAKFCVSYPNLQGYRRGVIFSLTLAAIVIHPGNHVLSILAAKPDGV